MRLREIGVANFQTTQEHFDRDYPGHFLRLIKKVSVTVIALNNPTEGIRATLTNGGVSNVVTGGILFQTRPINRQPEQIALSSGVGDAGVFQLQAQGEFLDPFEGTGVESQWEFRMEKAANPFDYESIADVLITVEYEALSSHTYRQTVVKRLNEGPTGSTLAISLKNNLPDQWFDLNNADQTATPYAVTFELAAKDLLPDLGPNVLIDEVLVIFSMTDGQVFNHVVRLGVAGSSGEAQPGQNNVAKGGGLLGLQGQAPTGTWSLSFPDMAMSNAFTQDQVEDIWLVIGCSGDGIDYLT